LPSYYTGGRVSGSVHTRSEVGPKSHTNRKFHTKVKIEAQLRNTGTGQKAPRMSILAHFSDLHVIERDYRLRSKLQRSRLRALGLTLDIDYESRSRRVAKALSTIREMEPDHVLITGDLTEDGVDAQFEALAELLHDSGLDPEKITLVPGNHDGYSGFGAWDRALAGPLRSFLVGSNIETPVVLPTAVVIPVSTMIENQVFFRAQGVLRLNELERVRRVYSDPAFVDRAIVVAQHHPPSSHLLPPMEWLDGTINAKHMKRMLLEKHRLHIVHGHLHYSSSEHIKGRPYPQVLSTASTRDQWDQEDSVRFYKVEQGMLRSLTRDQAASYRRSISGIRPNGQPESP
jgi:3',5'-cyclic-AMP phosphodiesterase